MITKVFASTAALLVSTGWLCSAGATPFTSKTVSCGTGGQTITAAINSLPPTTGYSYITVSGKCIEALYIPAQLAVHIAAANGTTLTPPSGNTNATVSVDGKLIVDNLAISAPVVLSAQAVPA